MEEKNKNIVFYIILGVFAILVIIFIVLLNKDDKENVMQIGSKKYTLVDNIPDFFTIENCANRYISVVSQGKREDALKLLNQDYMNKYQINIDNVVAFIPKLEQAKYNFEAKLIYKDNKNTYYLYGLLTKEIINKYSKGEDFYLIININGNIFDVTPYDGTIFKKGVE